MVTTILDDVTTQQTFKRAMESGGEFRVLVRNDGENVTYSSSIAAAHKLKRPKKFQSGWTFSLRIRPKEQPTGKRVTSNRLADLL